jgi:hypothetical protein
VKRVWWLLVGGLCAGACTPGDVPPPEDNREPVARLIWPQRWVQDEPAPFDATGSADTDGVIVRWSASFGDGAPEVDSSDGTFEHLYTTAGTFDVRMEVEDDVGATAEVVGTVVVVDRIDDPACSCDLPCFDEAVCTGDGCFLAGMSEEESDLVGPPPTIEGGLVCGS